MEVPLSYALGTEQVVALLRGSAFCVLVLWSRQWFLSPLLTLRSRSGSQEDFLVGYLLTVCFVIEHHFSD